jgi:hypothetical protein
MQEYPTPEEFKDLLLSMPIEEVVREYVFRGLPYIFRRTPQSLNTLYRHLCPRLNLVEQDITVVGSAKIGFSLSPHSFPRKFTTRSDIDVLVVSESLFDLVWMTMLRWHYPRRSALFSRTELSWTNARKNDLYWGWFVPSEIRYEGLSFPQSLQPLRDISTSWFNAFRSLSLYPDFVGRNVSGRLYRTWEHALQYHVSGLSQIADVIRQERDYSNGV